LDGLVEAARQSLGPAIVAPYLQNGDVYVISMDPPLEHRMLESMRSTDAGPVLALDPELGHRVLVQLDALTTQAENTDQRPVLVCAPQIRAALRRMIRPTLDRLPVLAYTELSGSGQV